MNMLIERLIEEYAHLNSDTRVIDGDGIRIEKLAIDYDKMAVFMWNGEDWIKQDINDEDLSVLLTALVISATNNVRTK